MKSFADIQDAGAVFDSTVAAYEVNSACECNGAVQSYRRAQQRLRTGGRDVSVEQRLARIEGALDALLDGLVKQREQTGSGVA